MVTHALQRLAEATAAVRAAEVPGEALALPEPADVAG
jgi:hypothetical protein